MLVACAAALLMTGLASAQRVSTQAHARNVRAAEPNLFGDLFALTPQLTANATSSSAQIAIIPAVTAPVPSGQASVYTINFSCSAVSGNECGANPVVRIPIADVAPAGADPSSWTYGVSSNVAGLIANSAYDPATNSYVINLNEGALVPGSSDTIQFSVKQPNNVTPDGTSWSLTPTFETDAIPAVTAPSAATGSATASANLSVSKNTNDGGSVYVVGNHVIYNITARCNSRGATGNLYLASGSLIDTLPPELTFESATPTPTSSPTSGSGGTIRWDYASSSELPSGCSADGSGTTSYQVVAKLDPDTPNNTSVPNTVEFTGIPLGETTPISTTASKNITAIRSSPSSPGNFISKSAIGPLNIPDHGYAGTYPGHWIVPANTRPGSSPGSAEGEYTVSIKYPASRAFKTALVDPVPCLDSKSGVVYSSNTPGGDIDDAASVDHLCQAPAFNPTVVQVSSASLASAVSTGWRPVGIERDGATFDLKLNGTAGTSAYFEAPADKVGHVAAILLPANIDLTDVSMSMNVFGYGDRSLIGGDVLHDVATATAYPVSGDGRPVTRSHSADLYIEDGLPQLGVYKTFGSVGSGPGGTTLLNITGHITAATTTKSPLPGDVIISDLLPYGLSWANRTTSAKFKIADSAGSSTQVTATVESIKNFNDTGRELIRVKIPSAAIGSGFYTITPPSGFIALNVPPGAQTYNNTIDEFVAGIGQRTASECGPGTGTTPSAFESSDPEDLSGTGVKDINHCSWQASLTVPPIGGPAFSLVKTVQGNLDPSPKYPLGIGNASQGGTGVYTITWSNTGSVNLQSPVIYDILPYVGDTGVDQGQAATSRDSQFATIFTGVSGVPAGVTTEYSESTNPCRNEVYADSANPDCVNDWSATPPADLAAVKAVRFISAGTYASGQSFSVKVSVKLPHDQVNTVAWNSAAGDAQTTGGSWLLPASPPKVGISATAPPLTPELSTDVSQTQIEDGGSVHDTITVSNTGGGNGAIEWHLVGPIAPAANGACEGLDWKDAATVDSGTITISGDGTDTTPASNLTAVGCYSYGMTLDGTLWSGPVTSPAGSEHETVLLANPAQMTIVKDADRDHVRLGEPVTYTIVARNDGHGDAYGVSVIDTPRTPFKFVSADPEQGQCGDKLPLTCELGTIAAGHEVRIKLTAIPLTIGTAENGARVTVTNPDACTQDECSSTSEVHVSAALQIVKRAAAKIVYAGDLLKFEIEVTNPNPVRIDHVTACDAMPAGLAFVSSSKHAHLINGDICWSFAIGAHAHNVNTITTRALKGASGNVTNRANVSGPDVVTGWSHAKVTILPRPSTTTPVTG